MNAPPPLTDDELKQMESVYGTRHPYVARLLVEHQYLKQIETAYWESVNIAIARKLEYQGLPPEEMVTVCIDDRVKAVEEAEDLREQLAGSRQASGGRAQRKGLNCPCVLLRFAIHCCRLTWSER